MLSALDDCTCFFRLTFDDLGSQTQSSSAASWFSSSKSAKVIWHLLGKCNTHLLFGLLFTKTSSYFFSIVLYVCKTFNVLLIYTINWPEDKLFSINNIILYITPVKFNFFNRPHSLQSHLLLALILSFNCALKFYWFFGLLEKDGLLCYCSCLLAQPHHSPKWLDWLFSFLFTMYTIRVFPGHHDVEWDVCFHE